MQRSKNDVWVGLFVLIGAVAILFLALQSANLLSLSFQTTYRVVAKFDNVGGLKPKAAVRSAGVVVGRVEKIVFDDKSFQARVTLALESRYVFPKDSSLKILTSGLLGEQYLGLEAGADVIETDTFGATSLVLAEYDIADQTFALNLNNAFNLQYLKATKQIGDGRTLTVSLAREPEPVPVRRAAPPPRRPSPGGRTGFGARPAVPSGQPGR